MPREPFHELSKNLRVVAGVAPTAAYVKKQLDLQGWNGGQAAPK